MYVLVHVHVCPCPVRYIFVVDQLMICACIIIHVYVHVYAVYRYCPGGPDSDFEYSTQSYTGYEPTSMRAIRARYNPYLQAKHRLEQVRCYIYICHVGMHY